MIRHRTRCVVSLGALLLWGSLWPGHVGAQAPPAAEAQPRTKVVQPRQREARNLSNKPQDVVPQLLASMGFIRRALELLENAQSQDQLAQAAHLAHEAYFYQRASHAAITVRERSAGPNSQAAEQWRLVDASRRNLLMARFRIINVKLSDGLQPAEVRKIENAVDYLQAALGQTQKAVALGQ